MFHLRLRTVSTARPLPVVQISNFHATPTRHFRCRSWSNYTVLAIETSCDDTSVAVIHVHDGAWSTWSRPAGSVLRTVETEHKRIGVDIIFHEKITANNDAYTGIHPLVALESHRANLAPLVRKAWNAAREREREEGVAPKYDSHVDYFPPNHVPRPEFVAVTRGPGMRSNIAVGLDTAKGLAAMWDVPLLAVHHMQAHALTPRLMSAMANMDYAQSSGSESSGRSSLKGQDQLRELEPAFPFLTVLVSGGHTMLVDSVGLTEHTILAETQDIAVGDFLDKAARAIMPPALLRPPYGGALEQFAFHTDIKDVRENADKAEIDEADVHDGTEFIRSGEPRYNYTPPARRQDELQRRATAWDWSLAPPLAESKGGDKSSRRMVYSFAGLLTSIERLMKRDQPFSIRERQDLACEVQRVAFEHLASRILLHLSSTSGWNGDTIVVSGGVASNKFLRHVLRSILSTRGYSHVKLSFPPIELCTDNALMIAWAAVEMYEAGYSSGLEIGPIRRWSMDPKASDGGILGVGGWVKEEEEEQKEEERRGVC